MTDQRAATITALRARLAALGGSGGLHPSRRAPALGNTERVADLGFHPEQTEAGVVFVRRRPVDLTGFLARCGLETSPPTAALMALFGQSCLPAVPSWVSGEGVGVLDIESLGLHGSGVLAFLVGTGVHHGDRLEAEQYLLVDPAGEEAMLLAICTAIQAHRFWLTYNGRSFDIPVLSARCVINRLDPGRARPRLHGDLLGPVRRLFRDRLGACTLRRAEMSLLNHHRVGDIPGSEAPGRYRAWLGGAPASVLSGVVEHNLQDIVSTVLVGARLAAHVGGERVNPPHAADAYHLGRHLERQGVADAAEFELRAAVDAAIDPWARRAAHRLALVLQRRGAAADAQEIWRSLHDSDGKDLRAARGYAIRLERAGDLVAALDVCVRVRRTRVDLGARWQWHRGGGVAGSTDWDRREARLRHRLSLE